MVYKYKAVKINGKKHDEHRLITEKKIGRKLRPDEVVHHIDGNGKNNNPDNLQVITDRSHRSFHGKKIMTSREARRRVMKNMTWAKLTETDVRHIRELDKHGLNSREIAMTIRTKPRTVRRVLRGENWSHVI